MTAQREDGSALATLASANGIAPRTPLNIQALADKVGMTPIGWREYVDRVVIVFEQGPKLIFLREDEAKPETPPETPQPVKRTRKPKK